MGKILLYAISIDVPMRNDTKKVLFRVVLYQTVNDMFFNRERREHRINGRVIL